MCGHSHVSNDASKNSGDDENNKTVARDNEEDVYKESAQKEKEETGD